MNVQAKTVTAGISSLILLGLIACSQDHVMQEVTSTTISAGAGGIARSHDGLVAIVIGPGALASDTDIRIETRRVGDGRLASASYDLGPDGLQFNGAVEIRFLVPGETRPMRVVNVDAQDPVPVEGSTHNFAEGLVRAPLRHFSAYALILNPGEDGGVPDAGEDPDGGTFFDAGTPGDGGPGFDVGGFDTGPRDGGPAPDGGGSNLQEEIEPNDSIPQAQFLQVGSGTRTVHGSIGVAGDEDYYRIVAPPGTVASLHAITYGQLGDPSVCNNIDTVLTLFNSAGDVVAENDDNGTPCSEISTLLSGGIYYLRVRHFASQTVADYYLDITLSIVPQGGDGGVPDSGPIPETDGSVPFFDAGVPWDTGVADGGGFFPDTGLIGPDGSVFDAGAPGDGGSFLDGGAVLTMISEVEPNNTPAFAQYVATLPATISGSILPAGDVDLYSFQAPPFASQVRAYTYTQLGNPSVCGPGTDTILTAFDGNFAEIGLNDDSHGTYCSELTISVTPGASYFFEVRHYVSASGTIPQYYLDIVD